jgi:tetratricopeptide (TPR) repeat protein
VAFFVAFYSYKGGVGRSLALANAAWSLAARGKRVVLLDLDLEAPGLQDVSEFSLRGSRAKKGFLEYAASYRKRGWCPEITRYVHPCKESPGLGRLWLMPSGALGATYQEQLGSLSWKRLHPKNGTAPFIEEFRKALVESFNPDYVLIDSRTGFSDIGGLSTHRLADMVVLVFSLTRTSIEGSVRAYRSFTSDISRVQTLQLVASPVPPLVLGAGSIVESRLRQAGELMPLGTAFGRTLIRIDFDPAMALAEELAVRNPDAFQAAARYETLREAIQRANPEEVFPILEQAHELRTQGKLEDSLALLHSFTEAHPENAEGYLELGNFLFEVGRARDAAQAFRRTRELAPDLSLGHRRLGEALVAADSAEEAIEALEKAEAFGDRTRELYTALARAYASKQEPTKEIEVRRKAMLAAFGTPDPGQAPSAPDLRNLRKEFVEVLSRRPPYPGFSPEAFWDSLLMSLDLSLASKIRILRQLLAGEMRPVAVNNLLRDLREEDSRWPELLGSEVHDFRRRLAAEGIDPFNIDAVLGLRRGDRVDSAILGFAALDGELPFDRRIALLEEAIQRDPENHRLQETFGQTLLDAAKEAPAESRRSLPEKPAPGAL